MEPVWTRPSLTITAIEAVPIAQAANQIADAARARLSLRTVRDLATDEAGTLLARALQTDVPHGAQVTTTIVGGPSWWEADPRHVIFTAARRALSRGFGADAVMIGSGGSIGFVKPFADLAGDIPPLLTGVQDPQSHAHSENESLDLSDWIKAMTSAVYLFHELAARMTRILTRTDLANLLTPEDCLSSVEEAFRSYGEGRVTAPKSLGLHAATGTFHIKAAIADVFAAKINANFPENPRHHQLPTIQGVIVVFDMERGTPLAILDSALITTLRTAAATAVAAKYLARRGAETITVIGCGTQGRASLEALRLVRPIRKVYAYDADAAAADRFAREMSARYDVDVQSVAAFDDAIAASDIVVTCTTARAAILDVRHLHPGLFIAAVGADNPEKQELTPALLRQSNVVADILEQSATMGDLHHALEAGVLTRDDVHGELADVICGRVRGRQSEDEVFVFDSTGTALQDVAVASLAYARAMERGVGAEVAFA